MIKKMHNFVHFLPDCPFSLRKIMAHRALTKFAKKVILKTPSAQAAGTLIYRVR
jgi:hypothetical protein